MDHAAVRDLVLAPSGATFTLRSKHTDKTLAYQTAPSADGKIRFVRAMTSRGSFAYLGYIRDGEYVHGKKSPSEAKDTRNEAMAWFWAVLSKSAPKLDLVEVLEGVPGQADGKRVFHTCKSCKKVVVTDADAGAPSECPQCKGKLKSKKLEATLSTKGHVCNVACVTAKGHVCVCSCGGGNHGKAHLLEN